MLSRFDIRRPSISLDELSTVPQDTKKIVFSWKSLY